MLRMGFIDDVTWIMEQTPDTLQVALFSATMPAAIKKVTERYLKEPAIIKIEAATKTVEKTDQSYWFVRGASKADGLCRILDAETFDAVMIFVRTKSSTTILAEKLETQGFRATAINGDMTQPMREKAINRLKQGRLDIVVATDVAARGIDVPRISHVINYDIPGDNETYIHRIGRTGRAGRTGKAILFVTPREKRILRSIEKTIGQTIPELTMPTAEDVERKRIEEFKKLVYTTGGKADLRFYEHLVEELATPTFSADRVHATLLYLAQKERPLRLHGRDKFANPDKSAKSEKSESKAKQKKSETDSFPTRRETAAKYDDGLVRDCYRIAVGKKHNATQKELTKAIAKASGLDRTLIGRIKISDDHSTVDLPEDMPSDIFKVLRKTRVMGHPLNLRLESAGEAHRHGRHRRKAKATRSKHRSSKKPDRNKGKRRKPSR